MGHRVEWWYVTGNLETKRGPMGFQVTFFRALSQNQIESRGDRLSSPTALADP
jgi:predicted secreted hydrolase